MGKHIGIWVIKLFWKELTNQDEIGNVIVSVQNIGNLGELNYNINGTNFSAPDAHFDNTYLFSDARGQNM